MHEVHYILDHFARLPNCMQVTLYDPYQCMNSYTNCPTHISTFVKAGQRVQNPMHTQCILQFYTYCLSISMPFYYPLVHIKKCISMSLHPFIAITYIEKFFIAITYIEKRNPLLHAGY